MKKTSSVTRTFLLILAAMIWGFTFSFQSIASRYVGAYTFLALRSWIAVLFLIPVIRVSDTLHKKDPAGNGIIRPAGPALYSRDSKKQGRDLIKAGFICGAFLCLASALQQIGIPQTTTAKASFITALYVILVPVFSIFLGKKTGSKIWLCALLSVIGLYFLCFQKGTLSGFGTGDLLILLSAFAFAVQILSVDHYVQGLDPIRLSQMQIFFQGIFSTVLMLLMDRPSLSGILHAAFPILFSGVLSSGVAYTLQIVGQRGLNPSIASISMCLESVFGSVGGWLILGQKLSMREISGCALMFAAIVLAQLPDRSSGAHQKAV